MPQAVHVRVVLDSGWHVRRGSEAGGEAVEVETEEDGAGLAARRRRGWIVLVLVFIIMLVYV
jgi:hypothetical protein